MQHMAMHDPRTYVLLRDLNPPRSPPRRRLVGLAIVRVEHCGVSLGWRVVRKSLLVFRRVVLTAPRP